MIAFSIGIHTETTVWSYAWGAILGILIGSILIGLDFFFRKFNLRSFNIVILGLFIGYLMSLALLLIFQAILDIASIHPEHHIIEIVKIFLFLFGTYLGVVMTLRASDELYLSLPFVKFTPSQQSIKDVLFDLSAIYDPRIIDLAATGLLDKRLILPRFLLKELNRQEEADEERARMRAKAALEVIKNLEMLPYLQLRYHETDFPDVKDISSKVVRLARLLDAEILSAELQGVFTKKI